MEKSVSRVACDSSLAGCLLYAIVGNDNSSATNGSSVASVAGKNRFPANPCAEAGSPAARLRSAARRAIWPRPNAVTTGGERFAGAECLCGACCEVDALCKAVPRRGAENTGDEVIAELPVRLPGGGSRRQSRSHGDGDRPRAGGDSARQSELPKRTALRAGEGWAAGWRKRGAAGRQRRFDVR